MRRARAPQPDPSRYVYVAAPRCPRCASKRIRAYRSSKNGDGSVTRYVACVDCYHRFRLVIE